MNRQQLGRGTNSNQKKQDRKRPQSRSTARPFVEMKKGYVTKVKGKVDHDEAGELYRDQVIQELARNPDRGLQVYSKCISQTLKSCSRECSLFRSSLRATTYMQNMLIGDKKKCRIKFASVHCRWFRREKIFAQTK